MRSPGLEEIIQLRALPVPHPSPTLRGPRDPTKMTFACAMKYVPPTVPTCFPNSLAPSAFPCCGGEAAQRGSPRKGPCSVLLSAASPCSLPAPLFWLTSGSWWVEGLLVPSCCELCFPAPQLVLLVTSCSRSFLGRGTAVGAAALPFTPDPLPIFRLGLLLGY